jgi:hypothetical protein
MNNEQLKQIKDLLKNNKRDRFVIFDNNEPALVVMSIDEYKKIARGAMGREIEESDKDLVENINRAIAEWKVNQAEEEVADIDLKDNEEEQTEEADFYDADESLSYYYDMDDEDN